MKFTAKPSGMIKEGRKGGRRRVGGGETEGVGHGSRELKWKIHGSRELKQTFHESRTIQRVL